MLKTQRLWASAATASIRVKGAESPEGRTDGDNPPHKLLVVTA
jgi:hypothetical protein